MTDDPGAAGYGHAVPFAPFRVLDAPAVFASLFTGRLADALGALGRSLVDVASVVPGVPLPRVASTTCRSAGWPGRTC